MQAVINWIDGYDGSRKAKPGVPAIFGMNFQAVSVGQKLAKAGDADTDKSLVGGYLNADAEPGNALTRQQFEFVDRSIGKMERELAARDIEEDLTLIIISAKHGQSPINVKDDWRSPTPSTRKMPGLAPTASRSATTRRWSAVAGNAAGEKPDDGKPLLRDARAYIVANATALHIRRLLDRDELTKLYEGSVRQHRVPDFIATTDHGVICTGGTRSCPARRLLQRRPERRAAGFLDRSIDHGAVVEDMTFTTQIAPTILEAPGLDPDKLKAVKEEGTRALHY